MKKLFFVLSFLLLVSSVSAVAQVASADIVVVRIDEEVSKIYVGITRGEGKHEAVEFDNGPFRGNKGLDASGDGYYKVFQKLYQEGYMLQSTFTVSSKTTLLFVKAPKP